MHPLLKSRALLAGYLAGWLAFGLVFFVSARVEQAPLRDALWLTLMAAGLAAALFPSSYYSCRALPLRSTPPLDPGGRLGGLDPADGGDLGAACCSTSAGC